MTGITDKPRTPRDPFPKTLEGVREDMDYWADQQSDGLPGSDFEVAVGKRLTTLRNLEQRFMGESRATTTKQLSKLEFHTAFNSYTFIGQRGQGGTGIVYEVQDSENVRYALKVLNSEAGTRKTKRFKNEIAFCSKEIHKNVVRVLDHGTIERERGKRRPFYVMPLYPLNLRQLMAGGIKKENVLPLFTQMLDGVEAAHLKGVWHRDLKPENVLVDPNDKPLVVADFGIARFAEEDLYTAVETQNQERLANFLYSAPEQRERGRSVDQRADIFALGLVLNEFFTRQVPQGSGFQRISAVATDYAYIDEIVDQMIQQNPERRPLTIEAIKVQLIARGNEFVSLQRLNSLRTEIIPEGQVDDPLIADPIRLTGTDYNDGMLHLQLSRPPNPAWIQRFQNLGSYQSILGKGPERFEFRSSRAYIPAGDNDAHLLVNYFKGYIAQTNRTYVDDVEAERLKAIEQHRRELQDRIAQEEKRQRILKSIQI